MWSKRGGTEDLRIIASISWGCVGDGNGGISQRSSQSNGIYVQHSGLQPGNKCLSLPRSHFLSPLSPSSSLSVCHLYLQYLCFYLPLSPSSPPGSPSFCVFVFAFVLCILSITCFLPCFRLRDLICLWGKGRGVVGRGVKGLDRGVCWKVLCVCVLYTGTVILWKYGEATGWLWRELEKEGLVDITFLHTDIIPWSKVRSILSALHCGRLNTLTLRYSGYLGIICSSCAQNWWLNLNRVVK